MKKNAVNVGVMTAVVVALTAGLALRTGDYSTVGRTNSWTSSLEWAPVSDLRLRATGAKATRAPNINELYSPPSQTFPQVTDPCAGVTATTSASSPVAALISTASGRTPKVTRLRA